MTPFYILLGFTACVLTSLAFGITAVRALRLEVNRLESVCLGYILGSAMNSMFALAIASLSIARKGVFLTIAALALVLLGRQYRWVRGLPPARINTIPIFWRLLFAAAWFIYGLLYFRFALSPEISPDGMVYHLGEVNLWAHAHGLMRLTDMYAALPQGVEMLFLFAFTIGRHSAAALVHFSFLMVLPFLMILYGIRFGFPGGAAVFAAIVVFATPLIGWDGSVAYNDVALAVSVFACVYLLQMWRSDKRIQTLLAAGILAGFSFAIKYTGCFLLLFVAVTVLWELRRESRTRLARTLVLAVAVMMIAPLPYFVRNYFWFHNPIAFFGNSIFRNPWFHVWLEKTYIRDQIHLNGVEWRDLPMNLTLGGSKLPESFGPLYLLAPIAIAGLFWPQTRFLIVAAAFTACAYPGNKSARFLIPVVPLLFLAVGFALSRLPRFNVLLGAIAIVQLVICWPTVAAQLNTPHGRRLSDTSWETALRLEPEDRYLRRRVDDYPMARLVESFVPADQTVFALTAGVSQSYTTRQIMDSYHSADAEKAFDLLYSNANSPTDTRRRWTAAFPEVRARQLKLLQTGKSTEAQWSVNEIRLSRNAARISPEPAWRFDAFPNPWDIGLAFDGNEATRWKSWEPMRPGMFIGVRFDRPVTLDRVDVSSLDGQWDSKIDLRILTDDGQWLTPAGSWQMDPALDSRRDATRELKREGIHYVVIGKEVWHPEEFTSNPALWGMREVASTKNATLYRID